VSWIRVYLSMKYFLFKKLLKSRIHIDLHHTEPVPAPSLQPFYLCPLLI
jgi:hypothetical protein